MTFEDTKQNISPPKDSNYFRKFHLSLGEYIIHMKECSKMAVIHFYLHRLMQKLLLFESLISGFEILSCQKKTRMNLLALCKEFIGNQLQKCLEISHNYLKCDQGLNVISENNR